MVDLGTLSLLVELKPDKALSQADQIGSQAGRRIATALQQALDAGTKGINLSALSQSFNAQSSAVKGLKTDTDNLAASNDRLFQTTARLTQQRVSEELKQQAAAAREAAAAQKAYLDLGKNLGGNVGGITAITQAFDGNVTKANQAVKAYQALQKAGADAANAQSILGSSLGVSANQFNTLANNIQKNVGLFDNLSNVVRGAGERLGANLTQAAITGLQALGQAITEVIAQSVRLSAQFESGTAAVSTLGADGDAVGQAMRQLSNDLGGAASAVELNAAAYDVLSSKTNTLTQGADDATVATQILGTSTKLAAAGFTTSAVASDALTSTLNAYKLSATDAASVADKFMATQNAGKITIAEYASQIGKLAPLAASAGISLDELNGLIANATVNGVKSEAAFTGLRTAISNTIKPSQDALDYVDRLNKAYPGLNLALDANALKQGGLAGILQKLNSVGADTSENLIKLFGTVEASSALAPSTGQGFQQFSDALQASANSAGITDAAYQKVAATLEFRMKAATNQASNAMLELGDSIQPATVAVFEAIAQIGGKAAESSNALDILSAASDRLSSAIQANPEVVDALGNALAKLTDLIAQGLAAGLDLLANQFKNPATAEFANMIGLVFETLGNLIGVFNQANQAIGDGGFGGSMAAGLKIFNEFLRLINAAVSQLGTITGLFFQCTDAVKQFGNSMTDLPIIKQIGEAANAAANLYAQLTGLSNVKTPELKGGMSSGAANLGNAAIADLAKEESAKSAPQQKELPKEKSKGEIKAEVDTAKDAAEKQKLEDKKKFDEQNRSSQRAFDAEQRSAKKAFDDAQRSADKAFAKEIENEKATFNKARQAEEKAFTKAVDAEKKAFTKTQQAEEKAFNKTIEGEKKAFETNLSSEKKALEQSLSAEKRALEKELAAQKRADEKALQEEQKAFNKQQQEQKKNFDKQIGGETKAVDRQLQLESADPKEQKRLQQQFANEDKIAQRREQLMAPILAKQKAFEEQQEAEKAAKEEALQAAKEAREQEAAAKKEALEIAQAQRKEQLELAQQQRKEAFESAIEARKEAFEARKLALAEAFENRIAAKREAFEAQNAAKREAFETQIAAKKEAFEEAKRGKEEAFQEEQRSKAEAFQDAQRAKQEAFNDAQRAKDLQLAKEIEAIKASSAASESKKSDSKKGDSKKESAPAKPKKQLFTGGPIAAGETALVNERGPELFKPSNMSKLFGIGDGSETAFTAPVAGQVISASDSKALLSKQSLNPAKGQAASLSGGSGDGKTGLTVTPAQTGGLQVSPSTGVGGAAANTIAPTGGKLGLSGATAADKGQGGDNPLGALIEINLKSLEQLSLLRSGLVGDKAEAVKGISTGVPETGTAQGGGESLAGILKAIHETMKQQSNQPRSLTVQSNNPIVDSARIWSDLSRSNVGNANL